MFPPWSSRRKKCQLLHCFKVANPARLVPLPPIEGVRLAAGGAGLKSETLFSRSPSGVQGGPPDTPLVTFVVKRKSPGCRAWLCHALAERLHQGWSAEEGPSPPRISGHAGAPAPAPAPPGRRSPPFTYTPKRTKSCIPTCNRTERKIKKEEALPACLGESLFACCV